MSTSVEEVRLSLPHIELAAHLYGPEDGLPVIALHGWLDNANSFARLAPKLVGLRIVALDMAGHGHSAHRPAGAGYACGITSQTCCKWPSNWAGNVLPARPFPGAIVSLVLAGALPERVTHLALIDGVIRPPPKRERCRATAWRLQAQLVCGQAQAVYDSFDAHRSADERLVGRPSKPPNCWPSVV
jgi:pimeloyl-ACP methyl ester carboxylesterase